MKFNHPMAGFRNSKGFSLLEAMVSVALIGVALVATFSVIKVVSQGKSVLDERTNFYLSSLSFSSNLSLIMKESVPTDIQAIGASEIVYVAGYDAMGVPNPCPYAKEVLTFKGKVKDALCKVRFLKLTQVPAVSSVTKSYKVEVVSNLESTAAPITNHWAFKLTYTDISTNSVVFERVLLHVK